MPNKIIETVVQMLPPLGASPEALGLYKALNNPTGTGTGFLAPCWERLYFLFLGPHGHQTGHID